MFCTFFCSKNNIRRIVSSNEQKQSFLKIEETFLKDTLLEFTVCLLLILNLLWMCVQKSTFYKNPKVLKMQYC